MISDARASALVQEVLCVAPPTWLNLAEEHFLMNLDFFKPIQVKSHLVCWGGGRVGLETSVGPRKVSPGAYVPAGCGRSLFNHKASGVGLLERSQANESQRRSNVNK